MMRKAPIIGDGFPNKEGWASLLEAWFKMMDDFVEVSRESQSGEDVPYWYNEYSNRGFLAAAVWKLGGVSISEYTVEKVAEGTRIPQGRCDLWFCVPKLDMEYAVETKFGYVQSVDAAENTFRKLAEGAKDQIRTYNPEKRKKCQHITAVFLSPYNQSLTTAREILDELYKRFSLSVRTRPDSLCAVYEPPLGTVTEDRWTDGILSHYPGVALLAQLQNMGE